VAYLVGLCHDLGDILFRTHFAAEYGQVLVTHDGSGLPLDQLERQMLGITHGELASAILRRMALPPAILVPIESMNEAMAQGVEPRDRLARILRAAEFYANALQLAAAGNAPIAPLTKAQCKNACGETDPSRPDGQLLRAEVVCMTSMLARLSRGGDDLMEPLCPKRDVRLWLARERGLSTFDPVHAALEMMADVKVADALPGPGEAADCDGLVVVARTVNAGGMTQMDVARAAAHGFGRASVPVLWRTATTAVDASAGAQTPSGATAILAAKGWPISIDELATFVAACEAGHPAAASAA
jgi:hypothetical protein